MEHRTIMEKQPIPNLGARPVMEQQPIPDPATLPPRILPLYRDGTWNSGMRLLDSDKTTVLYTANTHFRKPQLQITRPAPAGRAPGAVMEILVGSATFHSLSRTIDLQVGTSTILFEPAGLMRCAYFFHSRCSGVGRLKWEYPSTFSSNLELVTANGQWLARFVHTRMAWTKKGSLEMAPGVEMGTELWDEVIVSGLAMLEVEKRRNRSSSSGGSGGGSVGM